MSCHNTVKIVFFTKNFTSYLSPFQATYCKHTVKLCSRYYIARVVTTLNYAKKNVIFITIHNFINKEKRININQKIFCQFLFYKKTAQKTYQWVFIFSYWGTTLKMEDLIPTTSRLVSYVKRYSVIYKQIGRFNQIGRFFNTISLPVVVQVYEFLGKFEKVKAVSHY